jgi:hypothetical protein
MFETQAEIDSARQEIATVQNQVLDLHSQFQQLLNEAEQRHAILQQTHSDLVQHLQSEHARAQSQQESLAQLLGDAETWGSHEATTLSTTVKSLDADLAQAATDFTALTQALQTDADRTQQTLATVVSDLTALEAKAQTEVGQAYGQAGADLVAATEATHQDLAARSDSHAQSIDATLNGGFAQSQTQFLTQLEQLVAALTQMLNARADTLHGEFDQHVRNLQDAQDGHQQEVARTVDALRALLQDVASLISAESTAHTQRVDSATDSMHAMQLSVREITQVLTAIAALFQEILSMW